MPTAIDTSVVIASLLPWHEHHAPARQALIPLLSENTLILPVPTLVESYSVMTRFPGSRRLSPTDAYGLLFETFDGHRIAENLKPDEVWKFLAEQRDGAVHGGSVYDALILTCARRCGADRVLTFNRRHFERLAPPEIAIKVPGES